ncbi:hypothetical protein ACS0TY_011048 [Phlomoides rotata]
MGDFNVVLGAHEHSRGARNPARPSLELMAFLDEAHLHDMDTYGPQFTWSTSATMLPRISSDHHPILLQLHKTSGHVVRPFRFQHMWTSHRSFTHTVSASWAQHTTASSPIQLVTQKLKWLKATLKNWNWVTFRNIYVEMEEASEALNVIQSVSALYGDSDDRLLAEIDSMVHLNTVLNQHQINSTQQNRL